MYGEDAKEEYKRLREIDTLIRNYKNRSLGENTQKTYTTLLLMMIVSYSFGYYLGHSNGSDRVPETIYILPINNCTCNESISKIQSSNESIEVYIENVSGYGGNDPPTWASYGSLD